MQTPAITTPEPILDSMRREAREALTHAARIAAIARERCGAAPVLDRDAFRRQTARRLAAEGGPLSGS